MQFKKHYTEEEVDGVVNWFHSQFDRLPESLDVDSATHIPDLKKTVKLYFDIARTHRENPTYAAQIYHLFLMREAVMAYWNSSAK